LSNPAWQIFPINISSFDDEDCSKANPPCLSISRPHKRVVVDSPVYGLAVLLAIPQREKHFIKKENIMPIAINPKPKSEQKDKVKPVADFRENNLRLTIWANIGKNGVVRHSHQLRRCYQADGKWYEVTSWGDYDYTALKKITARAEQWVLNLPSFVTSLNAQIASN
jgi:hypothetical protein